MCLTIYQKYSDCDCFLAKIEYCQLSTRLLETPCPEGKERIRVIPFDCEYPRLEADLRFEGDGKEVEKGE